AALILGDSALASPAVTGVLALRRHAAVGCVVPSTAPDVRRRVPQRTQAGLPCAALRLLLAHWRQVARPLETDGSLGVAFGVVLAGWGLRGGKASPHLCSDPSTDAGVVKLRDPKIGHP